MTFPISHHDFAISFPIGELHLYEQFVEKLSSELATVLHPSAKVAQLAIVNTWKDGGSNLHAVLKGFASLLGNQAQIGGEIVLLVRSRGFRGKMWSSLANPSDVELLALAREKFRDSKFADAHNYLRAIRQFESLPKSAQTLKKLLLRRIGDSATLSTESLATDWLRPEEDEAWKRLQNNDGI